MAKAASLNDYPWSGLGDSNADSLLSKDYPFKNFETYKVKATSTNNAAIEYKSNFNILKKSDAYSGSGGDELKITFPVSGTDVIARLLTNRKGDLEGHMDFKEKEISGKKINFFANFKTQFDFNSIMIRTGGNYWSDKMNVAFHVETDLTSATMYKNVSGKQNKMVYECAGKMGCDGTVKQYDACLGYQEKDYDLYLKHLTGSKTTSFKLQDLCLQAVLRNKDVSLALSATKDLGSADMIKDVEIGGAYKCDDKTNIKAKINKGLDLGLSAKYKHNSSYTFTVGAKVPCATVGKGDSGKLLPFDLGLQVDLNI